MAGSYPDLPAPRIEYDRDGTRGYTVMGSTVTETITGLVSMNDETFSTYRDYPDSATPWAVLLVFPEQRDITHALIDIDRSTGNRDPIVKVEWSNDSTTGLDGTWTTAVADWSEIASGQTGSRYRSDIAPVPGLLNVRMVKFTITNNYFHRFNTLHLYGKATAGQNLHRLRLWHPTLDAPLDDYPAHLDWGNVPQNSSATRQFRVKNDSPSMAASGIKVFMQALSEANPTQVSQHTLSLDGTTFVSSASPGVSPPALPAQQISGQIHLKRTTLTSAQLGLWRQRLVASADTWT